MAYASSHTSSPSGVSPSTKLRRLRNRSKLIEILNLGDCWKELAAIIPNPDKKNEYLFTANDIFTLESQYKYGNSPAQSLIEHWSTWGKNQPTLEDLLSLLEEARLFRAADYVRTEILKIPVTRNDDSDTDELDEMAEAQVFNRLGKQDCDTCNQNVTNKSYAGSRAEIQSLPELDNSSCELNIISYNPDLVTVFRYDDLARLTQGFCDTHEHQGGCKIGEGTYGSVYRARLQGQWIAVKRLKEAVDKQFFTELNVLTRFKHENLLPLLGFSDNGPHCCIVYSYMKNGSLQERLACINNTPPVLWKLRIYIACGAARGINHLHTFGERPMIHRDIKRLALLYIIMEDLQYPFSIYDHEGMYASANILLDENFVAKVGDFGIARTGSLNNSSTIAVTNNIYGTSVYMAREAFSGDVSVKLDTFSFGVVLLELLTGLPPYDVDREEKDLVSHVENCDNILTMLDRKAGKWNTNVVNRLYDISKLCLEMRKKDRPTMTQVLGDLESIHEWES